ncbi:MAG TPA: rhodanese-related sulfurtransferase [Patescibacteria group bacterium]|nr:rhodanese-related sulfurtransferase [Patescibacteria group bacterium]
MYQILLYYKYVDLPNPEELKEAQIELCQKLNLKGRIIVSNEGINGTLEGKLEDTEKYISSMNKDKLLSGITYKKSEGTGNAFPKLRVRVRPEIVTSGVKNLNPNKITGKYISSEELYSWFENKKEFYIVDMRNDYEFLSGHFEGSIASGMKNFFELGKVAEKLLDMKDKTIVTVCTGGVRCEKASGFLLQNGFKDVYQLKDGIQTFMETYPNKYFKGKLYVFDNRMTLGFNTDKPEHEVIARCSFCQVKSENYVNCELDYCHKHFISCHDCLDDETGFAFCNSDCKNNWKTQRIERENKLSSIQPLTN